MKKIVLLSLVLIVGISLMAKNYVYSEHYPVLPQPWYFTTAGFDVDTAGNIYVASSNRIFKLAPDGTILMTFTDSYIDYLDGSLETRDFVGLEVDSRGYIYAHDISNYWMDNGIAIYDPQGHYVSSWYVEGFWTFFISSDDKIYIGYISHSGTGIKVFDINHNLLFSFGSYGSGPGEFSYPSGIHVDNQGNIYVTDPGNYRVQKFDHNGNFLLAFGTRGSGPGQFEMVGGITMDNQGRLYVGDSVLPRIQIFSSDGVYLSEWSNPGTTCGTFSSHGGVLIKGDRMYDAGDSRIQVFDLNHTYLGLCFGPYSRDDDKFWQPSGIDVDHAGNVYVADAGNNKVKVFDRKWQLKMVIGSEGTGPGEFDNPAKIAVDDEGHIFVLDKGNYRVQKFSKRGEYLTEWGGKPQVFDEPMGIAVDKDGYVYVADRGSNAIKKYTNDGIFVLKFGQDLEPYSFKPQGVAADTQGKIYAPASWGDELIVVFSSDGQLVDTIYHKDVDPWNMDVSNKGDLFVVGTFKFLAHFNSSGTLVDRIGEGAPLIEKIGSGDVAVDDQGRVYSVGNGRVTVYRPTPGAPRTIPAAASTTGANGTHWQSDVTLFNPGNETINIELTFLQAQTQTSAAVTLDPLESLTLPDLIANLFDSTESFGAVTSINLEETQPLILSRTYNRTNDGTFGQGIRASPYEATFYEGETAYLTGLKRSDTFRTNIGFVNLRDFPIELTITLHDEAGEVLGEGEYTLPPYGHKQVNAIFNALAISDDHAAAWGEVYTETPGGRFTTYASIVDNRSGDPVYIEGEGLGERSPDDWELVLPVIASAPGAYGTQWHTEVVLTNVFVEPMEVQLTYYPADRSGPYTHTLSLEPGEVFQADDLLSDLFSLDNTFGYLTITTNATGLQARGRIATGEGEGGSYGQGIPARRIKECERGASPLYLLNLKENAAFRSNAGFINLSEDAIVMTLDLIGNGEVLASKTQSVPARTLIQINSVLPLLFGVTGENYTLRITAPENALYTAYLSTVDNATGDPVFASGQTR